MHTTNIQTQKVEEAILRGLKYPADKIASALHSQLPLAGKSFAKWIATGRKESLLSGKEFEDLAIGIASNLAEVGDIFTDDLVTMSDIGCPLQAWAIAHQPDEKLTYGGGYWDQIIFVRDRLPQLIFRTFEESEQSPVLVVSAHRSKSVDLPVYKIVHPKVTLYLRYNFYDWKVSVRAIKPVDDIFHDLFDRNEAIHKVYFEGFEHDWIFGSFNNDPSKFSVELHDNHKLYTFVFLLSRALHLQK